MSRSRKAFSIRGIIVLAVVAFLLYWVINSPDSATVAFKDLGIWVKSGADALIRFFTS
jgi:hypothetical protein